MESKKKPLLAISQKRDELAKLKRLKQLSGEFSPEKTEALDSKLGELDKQILRESTAPDNEVFKVKNITPKIETRDRRRLKTGQEFIEAIANKRALRKAAKQGLKAVPLIGGIASALGSGDVSAAIPVLGEADELGPEQGSPSAIIEDPSSSEEMRKEAIRKLKERSKE